jgi:Domain of unknown function (DUF4382)
MNSKTLTAAVSAILISSLAACGGGSGATTGATSPPVATVQTAKVPVLISDAATEDWAMIGVKVLTITLTPQDSTLQPVTVYTAPTAGPALVNIAQLDNISDVIGNPSIPVGTYVGATLTVAANPGDVTLVSSADPASGFAVAPNTAIAPSQIDIQGAQGTTGNLTVPIKINFENPISVSATQTTAVNLEFDLAHPAFIVGHVPANGSPTVWAVNFKGPVHHHRIGDVTRMVLRHMYGTVSSVSADNTSITIAKQVPTLPVVTPETATSTGESLSILADATNGTIVYDVDAKTETTLKDFSSDASTLTGKFIRIAARYQQNGSLIATRLWVSSSFANLWVSPEGHVLHVDAAGGAIVVTDETGKPVRLAVDANTEFLFHSTSIETGTAFLTGGNLSRGFKVSTSVVDPTATRLVAKTVDIETASFDGRITNADTLGLSYSRNFRNHGDAYTVTLPYIAATSANGTDSNGTVINGFKYWEFAYPTLVTSGSGAISSFVATTTGAVDFGGTFGKVYAAGVTHAVWGDAGSPNGWSAPWTVLLPTPLPRGTVATGLANNAFTMTVSGGTTAATITVSTTPGAATLVYQVDRSHDALTVSPQDITTPAGLTALTNGLAVGQSVKVYAVPEADGTLKSYVITYFTGDQPES